MLHLTGSNLLVPTRNAETALLYRERFLRSALASDNFFFSTQQNKTTKHFCFFKFSFSFFKIKAPPDPSPLRGVVKLSRSALSCFHVAMPDTGRVYSTKARLRAGVATSQHEPLINRRRRQN
jgi:hypothetical protein